MTARIDLLTPAQDALVAALKAASLPTGVQVFQNVPEDTQPPYMVVGRMTSANQEESGDQYELITAEVIHIYRGSQRRQLLAMMHAARLAIDNQTLSGTGVAFTRPRIDQAEAGEVMPDGVTYVGIQTFEFFAEPA